MEVHVGDVRLVEVGGCEARRNLGMGSGAGHRDVILCTFPHMIPSVAEEPGLQR